jgi:MFS family permease
MFRSLRSRNFRLFFLGQIFSLTGSWVQQTAQSWLVYRLTKDPLMLGLAAFAGQFPVFLLGFYAGFKVDQIDHLRLVRWTQGLAMTQALILAALAASGLIQVWHVFILALIGGLINAFDMPARQVLIGELVPLENRHNAIALNSTVVNATRIFGPALAGLLIGWSGEGLCFALNGVSFLGVLLALFMIENVRQSSRSLPRPLWEEIGAGLAYVMGHEPIRVLLFLLTAFSLAGLPLYVLLPVFAEDILRSGAQGLGILSSCSGLGATCGALLLAKRSSSRGLSSVITSSLVLFGLALSVFAFTTIFWLSCVLLWIVGWSAIQVLAGVNTLLQDLSSDHFRGRVMSFYAMIFIGLSPLGSFMVGGLASRVGVSETVLAEGLVCIFLGVAYSRSLPAFLKEAGAVHPTEPSVAPPL